MLNEFQVETEAKLKDVLSFKQIAGNFKIDAGQEESATIATIGPYVCWIYPDGADVSGDGIDKRFEIYDYDSLKQLQMAFIQFVDQLLSRKSDAV